MIGLRNFLIAIIEKIWHLRAFIPAGKNSSRSNPRLHIQFIPKLIATMIRPLTVIAFIFFSTIGYSQKIPLINSGEVIQRATVLYDSGKYDEAVAELKTVSKLDTNYVYMLSELAMTYTAQEKYAEAIKTCDEGLATPSSFRAHILRSKAIALDKKGDYKESVALFNKSIDEFPFDFRMIYNLGVTYYNNKDYDKALDCFFRVLAINPFHGGSHYNLSRMSVGMGMKTHAMLAMGMYLGVNNDDNDRLVFIDKVVSNQVEDEGSLEFKTQNSCGKLDQIIRSKVAMDKSFKTQVPVDAPVVKQFEMLFEQLNTLPVTSDDQFLNYYLSIYKSIKDQNMVEPFMYHILKSASNEQVKKWRNKNEKQLKLFYDVANKAMTIKREVITVPTAFKYEGPVQAWYGEGNRLEAIGKKDADKREGQWYYFFDNGVRSAEGKFKAGEKVGIWKYYRDTGVQKSVENMDTGEVNVYFESGAKSQHFFLKNDAIDGDVELYFECGGLREKLKYKEGKRHGKGVSYYASGAKDVEYEYSDEKLTGEYLSYYGNGKLFSRSLYKDDVLQGKYSEYYANGKLRMEGEYVAGKVEGPWKYYFSNGKLEKEGGYKNGVGNGEWNFYNAQGGLEEKRNLVDGKWQGDDTFYDGGKLHYVLTYKNDVLVKVRYVDKNGKELGKFENGSGNFNVKTYYANGQLNGEGAYKKGKMEGAWKYYFPEGTRMSEFIYKEGEATGAATEYFHNGAIKFKMNYKNNQFDGYFIEYYVNGKVKQEGWFQNGERQQQWISYYSNGEKETEYYYLNDQLTGDYADYNTNGKLMNNYVYKNGRITDLQYYNSKGEKITVVTEKGNTKTYENKFKSGKIQSSYTVQCGNYAGSIIKNFPDGNTFYSYPMMMGNRHGVYKYYHLNGVLGVTGEYINGNEEGTWKWLYEDGKTDYTGKYIKGERDSVWTFFHPNGKISSTQTYEVDKRHGLSRFHGLDGTAVLEKIYEAGHLISYRTVKADGQFGDWVAFTPDVVIVANYPNGKTAYHEPYKGGLLEGTKRLYFPDGKLYSEYNFTDGNYNGAFIEYFANGKVSQKGTYKDDELEGAWETFYEDGTMQRSETFIGGSRNGKSVYYKKGVKVKDFTFWAGAPE